MTINCLVFFLYVVFVIGYLNYRLWLVYREPDRPSVSAAAGYRAASTAGPAQLSQTAWGTWTGGRHL